MLSRSQPNGQSQGQGQGLAMAGMERTFGRSPTFLVNTDQQRSNLDSLVRREQHLAEQYQKNKPLMFNGNAYQKTHPQKAIAPGHRDADATVVSPMLLGCADGVSQIEEFGLDASELPRELLAACEEQATALLMPDQAGKISDLYRGPIPLMREAFQNTESMGSTTVCLPLSLGSRYKHGKITVSSLCRPSAMQLLKCMTYEAPRWAGSLRVPDWRIPLGNLPTPLMPWACPALRDLNVKWSIKRDDMTGLELTGNKTRKLEFLMAEALAGNHDSVVTVGGLQSNHCRATAVAARMAGLEPHLVLLVKDTVADEDPGMEGNLLIGRLMGAKIHLCTASEYYKLGGNLEAADTLNERMAERLRKKGFRPYVIPVGGTTPLGTWGYLQAVEELREQGKDFDHVVVAAGSGGTLAGLAVGFHKAKLDLTLHGVNIQHSPKAYYDLVVKEADALGCTSEEVDGVLGTLNIHNGAGLGYAVPAAENLAFIAEVAAASGVVLDHVYSGKALYHFCEHARAHPDKFRNSRILFWHTGGIFGLEPQQAAMQGLLPKDSVKRAIRWRWFSLGRGVVHREIQHEWGGLSVLDNSTRIHGKLHPMMAIISIGDCELMVLRQNMASGRLRYETVFNTEMQRIGGNCQCPLQVCRVDGRIDAAFDERMTIEVIERGSAVHMVSVYEGDLVVIGSDGVFDNLFKDEVAAIVNQLIPRPSTPGEKFRPLDKAFMGEVARYIVEACHMKTKADLRTGKYPDTPIGKGGKRDDTCCVVGEVVEWTEMDCMYWEGVQRRRRMKELVTCGGVLSLGMMCIDEDEEDEEDDDSNWCRSRDGRDFSTVSFVSDEEEERARGCAVM
ncbi:putative 1-aminocyclopropane-1-carboxylate deaminase [Symbiodinium microadriaticum]|uniref:Putative 1-aminocyclopropane-1-carboxylate deaminase n=1 Tax=Symbiodinium microadriaticum TaxID=2951 RepID=A0A1Q9DE30_SYMMI|nr:putative 1-aminocyclopropane-1-carboxylate deaminase [Symbiodinium microadriaticum]